MATIFRTADVLVRSTLTASKALELSNDLIRPELLRARTPAVVRFAVQLRWKKIRA